jgi:hypothetical protein
VKKKVLFILLIFAIISPQLLHGEQVGIIETAEVVVLFDKPLKIVAKDTVEIYPRLKTELEKVFGWALNFAPTVALIGDRERFKEMTGSGLIVAYAIPQRNLIVIDSSRMNNYPFSLATILKHELCHLLLHDKIRTAKLPRWLDEGVSQWASDGVAEIIMSRKGSVLDTAVLSKKLISIERLNDEFPGDEKSLLLAYEESKSFVDYINQEFSRTGILNVLEHLRNGDEIDVAILESLSVSFYELERRWYSHLRKKITWFTYLANNLYGILFFLAGLITIAGFVKMVIRKRRYEDDSH